MALTQISTQGIKDGTISSADLADQSVTLAKLPHGTSSNDGKFLRANNGADPTFETVSSIGGGTGVDFDDNVKARFGTGNDLQIYHDGTNSHIDNATGALVIDVEGNTQFETNSFFVLTNDNENAIRAFANGAVELYHDNSKKLETTSEGVKVLSTGSSHGVRVFHSNGNEVAQLAHGGSGDEGVLILKDSGTATVVFRGEVGQDTDITTGANFDLEHDSAKLRLGAGNDLQIFHDGSHSFIKNTTNFTFYLSTQHHFKNAANNELQAKFGENAGVELYFDNSKKLETISGGISVTGGINTSLASTFATSAFTGDITLGDNVKAKFGADADLEIFYDSSANSKIQSNGSLTIKHSNGDKFIHCSSNSDVELYHDGTKKCNTDSQGISIQGRIHTQIGTDFNTFNKTGTGKLVSLMTNGTERGNISSNGSTVQFNTTASDKSLKKNFENWTENTLSLFKNINAQKFNFLDQEDGTDKEKGFIAQDMVASFPEAYQKNDDDKYMFNPSGMVVYLMKAIQELEAEVAALKAG